MTVAIKIENLYIGENASLQVKLYEVLVKFLEKKKKNYYRPHSLLRPTTSIKQRRPQNSEEKEAEPATSIASSNPYEVLQEEEEEVAVEASV